MDTLFSVDGVKSAFNRLISNAESDAQKLEKEVDKETKKDVSYYR